MESRKTRFKYLASFQKGKIPPELFKESTDTRLPYLSMEYLRGKTDTAEYAEIETALVANDDDTILLWDGSNAGEFIPSKQGVVSSTAALVRIKDVDKRYFFFLCKSLEPKIQAETVGMGIPHVDGDFVKELEIPLPPLDIQTKIANWLDKETQRIDALVEAKQKLLTLLAEKRRALISHAVTKGLNPKVKLKDSGIPWLGMIPEHWGVERVVHYFIERDERNQPDLPLMEVSIHHGVRVRELSDDKINQKAEDFNSYKVARKNDISFNKMRMWQGAVGCVPTDGLVSPDYVVACPITEISSDYYGILFKIQRFSDEAGSRSHGIVWDRLRLYWDEFKDISIPIPPLEEQTAIVDFLQKEHEKISVLEEVTQRSIDLIQERRSALITAAVTGELEEAWA